MTLRDPVLARLAELVEEASGNAVGPAQEPLLAEAGRRRAAARGLGDLAAYVQALEGGALADEWRQLLPLVTVKESYFFRTREHFRAVAEVVVPELLAARAGTRRLRLWSAGCARGEEPATLAMVLAEVRELAGWDWRILATDLDEEALARAKSGIYGARAVATVPEPLRRRYFHERGGTYRLNEALLERLDYRALNLVYTPFHLPDQPYDLVFLRNVLIYFRPEAQRRLVQALVPTVAPDGFLFLGPCETLWQLTDQLVPVDLGDCFCYRHPAPAARAAPLAPLQPSTCLAPPTPEADSPLPPHGAAARPASPPRLAGDEAVATAVRALAQNRLDEARSAVAAALLATPTEPAAHALEGLLADLCGNLPAALAGYRAALFLDPQLFQVRLLLADCLARQGARERARLEYRVVLRTIDSGRGRELPFAAALSLPPGREARERAARALRSELRPSS